jgi:hypothetical protein
VELKSTGFSQMFVGGKFDDIYFNIYPTRFIEKKRLQWYGHVKRMQEERLPKLIM